MKSTKHYLVSHLILKNKKVLHKYDDFLSKNRDLMFVDYDQTYYSWEKEKIENSIVVGLKT